MAPVIRIFPKLGSLCFAFSLFLDRRGPDSKLARVWIETWGPEMSKDFIAATVSHARRGLAVHGECKLLMELKRFLCRVGDRSEDVRVSVE
jgi:hypothetical protein